jgi:acyl-CoA hydrolase
MAPPARAPSESASVLTRWMGVADANTAGSVHGGRIMYLCDEVAGIAAIRHSGRRIVTAAVDRMNFLHPVVAPRGRLSPGS